MAIWICSRIQGLSLLATDSRSTWQKCISRYFSINLQWSCSISFWFDSLSHMLICGFWMKLSQAKIVDVQVRQGEIRSSVELSLVEWPFFWRGMEPWCELISVKSGIFSSRVFIQALKWTASQPRWLYDYFYYNGLTQKKVPRGPLYSLLLIQEEDEVEQEIGMLQHFGEPHSILNSVPIRVTRTVSHPEFRRFLEIGTWLSPKTATRLTTLARVTQDSWPFIMTRKWRPLWCMQPCGQNSFGDLMSWRFHWHSQNFRHCTR